MRGSDQGDRTVSLIERTDIPFGCRALPASSSGLPGTVLGILVASGLATGPLGSPLAGLCALPPRLWQPAVATARRRGPPTRRFTGPMLR